MAQTIIVDTTPGYRMPTIYYSQGDIGRTFSIDLQSRFGESLPASPTITIQATKPSGLGFSVASTSISGAVVTFTVTETMSNEAGRFPAELKIVKSGTTLFTANFYIECEASAHPEGTTDGDLDSILPKYVSVTTTTLPAGSSATYSYDAATNTATFGIPKGADGSLASDILAPTYSSSSTYAVGDYVYYNGDLYICNTEISTAEAWTSGHWTQVTVSGELSDVKDDLNRLYVDYNIYDKGSVEDGWFCAPDGSNAQNASWCRIDIPVTAGDKYSIIGGRFMTCYYTEMQTMTVVAGGQDYSGGQAVVTIPAGTTVMRLSALIANKSNMLVVKSENIVTDYKPYGTVLPAETFDVYSKEEVDDIFNTFHIVTIGVDYANLRSALEDIATKDTSYSNRYLVKVPKGTYDIRSLFSSAELASTKGLYVPPFTKIQGIGNPSEVVLNWVNSTADSTQAVLNLDCTAELENLTLYGEKLRYALHDDWTVRKWDTVTPYSEYWFDAFVNKGWVRTVKNCIFEVVDSPVRPAWGAGIVNGVRWLFENCTFITNKAYAISCHNNTAFTIGGRIRFESCIFTAPSAEGRFGRLTTISNNANGIINSVKFVGCKDTGASKLALLEEDASSLGTGCLWEVDGYADTFDNTDVQIVVTDGQDYSSRVNIIP